MMTEAQRERLAELRRLDTLQLDQANELAQLVVLEAGSTSRPAQYLATAGVAPDASRREVAGLALPYEEEMRRTDWLTGATRQKFAVNSAKLRETGAKLYYGHDHMNLGMPIGRLTKEEQTPAGLRIVGRISKTAKGDEVHELVQPDEDGKAVLDSFSVGYISLVSHLEEDGDLLVHDEVEVLETSVVADPQYQTATIDKVLSKTPEIHQRKGSAMTEEQRRRLAELRAMTTLSNEQGGELVQLVLLERGSSAGVPADQLATLASAEDLTALAGTVESIERRLATIGNLSIAPAGPDLPYSSYGEFLQAVNRGETSAVEFLAYVGGTIGDLGDWVKDSWVGDIIKPLTERRRVLNAFRTRPLPASGMSVEYGKLLSDTTAVAEQVNEGDVLAYGKIAFTTDSAPVKTYGGWGEMSRQEVERSAMQVVERFFTALVNRYARVTEAAVRVVATNPLNATELPGAANALATADDWIDFIVDGAFFMDDNGTVPEFLLVGRDRFKALAKLRDGAANDAPRLLNRESGQISVKGLSGNVFNVEVLPVNVPGTVRLCDSNAIETFEAAGAPFRLQDDDITNLTKAMSIYGYVAIAAEDKTGIVRPNDGIA